MDYYIKGLVFYFPPVNFIPKQKCAMCSRMKKPQSIKLRRYATPFIDMNEYLYSFLWAALNDKIDATELNNILLNSLPNS